MVSYFYFFIEFFQGLPFTLISFIHTSTRIIFFSSALYLILMSYFYDEVKIKLGDPILSIHVE